MSAPTRSRAPRLREETKALFRDAILEAAAEVFATRGFHGARIQDIAEQARIGVGTVYNHFAQKEDVLRALFDLKGAEMLQAFAASSDDPPHWEGRLRARWGRLCDYIDQHRAFYGMALDIGLFSPITAESCEAREARASRAALVTEMSLALLQDGVACGAIAGEPRHLARFLGGAFRGVVLGALQDGVSDLRGECTQVLDLFLRAVKPQGEP